MPAPYGEHGAGGDAEATQAGIARRGLRLPHHYLIIVPVWRRRPGGQARGDGGEKRECHSGGMSFLLVYECPSSHRSSAPLAASARGQRTVIIGTIRCSPGQRQASSVRIGPRRPWPGPCGSRCSTISPPGRTGRLFIPLPRLYRDVADPAAVWQVLAGAAVTFDPRADRLGGLAAPRHRCPPHRHRDQTSTDNVLREPPSLGSLPVVSAAFGAVYGNARARPCARTCRRSR